MYILTSLFARGVNALPRRFVDLMKRMKVSGREGEGGGPRGREGGGGRGEGERG